jgi:hypothetical protein
MALAHPPADAAPVPVTWRGRVLHGMLLLLSAATFGNQQPVLPHGLRAGRHDVAVRSVEGAPGSRTSVWYPAACGRRPAPAAPCRDAPPDSGRFPLLALDWRDGAATSADSATAAYLASHGYVVVPVGGTAAALRTLPFVDTARIATVQLLPPGALFIGAAGGWRFTVAPPPGASDHIRLSAAVTHAFLDAALRTAPAVLPDLARRLRAAGLAVRLVPVTR